MVHVSSVPLAVLPAVVHDHDTGILSLFCFTPCRLRLLLKICEVVSAGKQNIVSRQTLAFFKTFAAVNFDRQVEM
jgi:hypothetical protein